MSDRPATTDPVDPLCRAGQCGHERHALPDPLQPPRPMTDEDAAEFERRWSATVPPRASEAPRGDGSPTPDAGAARGGEGGSAAESEPRPMPDPDSPGERMLTAARTVTGEALRAEGIWYSTESTTRITARILARLIPLIRAQVADEITAHFTQERAQVADAEPVTLGGVHEQAKLLGRYDRVIATIDRIARGDQP